MITISLCMIVKDEEAVLARCLDSVSDIVDEIVIVDTGSTDKTMEIAKKYTDQVYPFPWTDDFSAARNASFSYATKEYILWLDADDLLLAADRQALLELKANFPTEVDVAMFRYNVGFDSRGTCTFHYYRERLVRRSRSFRWREPVHEHIQYGGVIMDFDIAVTHGPKERKPGSDRNLNIYRRQLAEGKALSPRGQYYYARELQTHSLWADAADQYRRFLDGGLGWREDQIEAAVGLSVCLRSLDRSKEALTALYASFTLDLPRPGVCCAIGSIYMETGEHHKAVYWYRHALEAPLPTGWGFIREDDRSYIPHVQLCVLYERLGQREDALRHHEAAKKIRPESPAVLHNEGYFYSGE